MVILEEVRLTKVLFWIRVFHVPMGQRNLAIATIIGNSVGEFMEWDDWDENSMGRSVQMPHMLPHDRVGAIIKAMEFLMKRKKEELQHLEHEEFHEAISNCNIQDHGFQGHCFTWSNMRKSLNNIQERLDRAIDNAEWRKQWHTFRVTTPPKYKFDHNTILLETNVNLMEWGSSTFEHIPQKIKKLRKSLEALQAQTQSEEVIHKIHGVEAKLDDLLRIEELHWE
ncbi:hypothetical protein VNO78_02669 [Psophocarpus tetragonolobus]|uniref:DUF4283 domain-containing protein n=1 Tax=Psophocarpus tetragonolobus TaxID=3891 RepID=A0AAN9TB26_PSOTE